MRNHQDVTWTGMSTSIRGNTGSTTTDSPFHVVGIALVVDQLGKGARMVVRYPAAPLSTPPSSNEHPELSSTSTSPSTSTAPSSEDLFFRLPPRQVAKLFRPKPALCEQPLTFSVGGTVFCCYAMEMDHGECEQLREPSGNTMTSQRLETIGAETRFASSTPLTEDSERYNSNPNNDGKLVLFSIVVALVPHVRSGPLPISGWSDRNTHSQQRPTSSTSTTREGPMESTPAPWHDALSMVQGKLSVPTGERASASFLSIRRVHVSLSRLARVLAREERRCRYVSLQANVFGHIRSQLIKQWYEQGVMAASVTTAPAPSLSTTNTRIGGNDSQVDRMTSGGSVSGGTTPMMTSTPAMGKASVILSSPSAAVSSGNNSNLNSSNTLGGGNAIKHGYAHHAQLSHHHHHQHHRRMGSFAAAKTLNDIVRDEEKVSTSPESFQLLPQHQQEVLETCMAAPSPNPSHIGNLAREFVQVYHALARNDHGDMVASPATILSGRDGIVYINRHIAVAIEAVSATPIPGAAGLSPNISSVGTLMHDDQLQAVRPYHTLLFPKASPIQLLDAMKLSGLGYHHSQAVSTLMQPRRLMQLLRAAMHPQHNMIEMAHNASLPLPVALEVATYLVAQGVAMVSLPIHRQTRLACPNVELIPAISLSFAQSFGTQVNLFLVVSILTGSDMTLGDAMTTIAASYDNSLAILLQQQLQESIPIYYRPISKISHQSLSSPSPPPPDLSPDDEEGADMFFATDPLVSSIRHHHQRHPYPPQRSTVADVMMARQTTISEDSNHSSGDIHVQSEAAVEAVTIMEDLVYEMAVWLCSRGVLVQLHEYLVLIRETSHTMGSSLTGGPTTINENESTQISSSLECRQSYHPSVAVVGAAVATPAIAVEDDYRYGRAAGVDDDGPINEHKTDSFSWRRSDNELLGGGGATSGSDDYYGDNDTSDSDDRVDDDVVDQVEYDDPPLFDGDTRMMLQTLLDEDCLRGTLSLPACSWRTGIDVQTLRNLATRRYVGPSYPHVRLVTRMVTPDDDY